MKRNVPGVEVITVENVPEGADAERVMENMIKQGATLIFAASFGYLEPALRVAARYPEVKFVHPGGYKRAPNLTTYWASTPEAFYLMGDGRGQDDEDEQARVRGGLAHQLFPGQRQRLPARRALGEPEGRDAGGLHRGLSRSRQGGGRRQRAPRPGGGRARGHRGLAHHRDPDGGEAGHRPRSAIHYIGAQKFAPKGWISGIAFTWGNLYTSFGREVMEGRWKSENILGSLADDFLTIAPFGPAVPPDATQLVNATKQELISGKKQPFQGPLRDNRGAERVKAGRGLPADRAAPDGLAGGGRDRPAEVSGPSVTR